MSDQEVQPSVIAFETAVQNKQYEQACQELINILAKVDSNFGTIDDIKLDYPTQLEDLPQEQVAHFCMRMAIAITALFTDPNLNISEEGAQRFFILQRWIAMIFASSPFVNADHILRTYDKSQSSHDPDNVHIEPTYANIVKFCILYLPESNIKLNLETLWEINPVICAQLCFALQSARFIATPEAFGKRSAILQWFPQKLSQFKNLDRLPSSIAHDVYMHCSYDIDKNKHLVKKALNQVIRSHLLEMGWQDRNIAQIGYKNQKPVMVVLLEHFHCSHSIYRTHSTSMLAARERFYLIGVGKSEVDQAGRDVFDEFHLIEQSGAIFENLNKIKEICEKNQAAIFYMPSLGMDLLSIFASNIRLAPIQAIALGHPATTHSDFIEYVIVEDDYVGKEECFSEKLLRLPQNALPYVPSALAPASVEYHMRENPEVVNIGIATTTMKLNPYFLQALKTIRDRAKVKVHFHFAIGLCAGVVYPYIKRFIKSYLGDCATTNEHVPYHQYLHILHNCDMMLNPFPFGNTNGIIDMVTLGLVGVCKTGAEVHEHIDEALFKRLGLPEWLIAHSADEYVERAIRLAENHQERLALRRYIIENNSLQTLFTGDPSPMGKIFQEKLQAWADANNIAVTLPKIEAASNAVVADVKVEKKAKEKSETKAKPKKTTAKKAEKPEGDSAKKPARSPRKKVEKTAK
ncbi:adhesin [Canicola haemoglobinophilus]|uniref:Adhesin processing HmwC-like protein n=1 Tax=Canicola haemoglobinophilus TaxID=733 RepID=A0A1V4AZD3_9PAST|nr:adhesin [Canicola haemoglobinophilus]OOR98421.1 adhesin [Canicola haemoglobinophilus]STO54993.1 adhesin processing HmwC-like protein [Canicola haemoglobinophilus]STO59611.1 adhesin processing HmwC-like protein [Canicola haemoglobinophilus]STO69436.1 adhesin processing HmwC-like protein [Canicola haemoglobinophilus]